MSVKTQYRHIAYCQHLCLNSLLGDSLQVGVTFEVSEEAACVVVTVPVGVARSSYRLLSGVRKDPSKPIDIDAIFKALKTPTGHPQVKGFQNNRVNGKVQHQIFLKKDQIGRLKCLLEMQGDVPFVLALKDFFDSLQQVDIEQLKGSSRKPLESRDVQSARANPRRPIRPRNGGAPQIAQADEHQSKPEAEPNWPGSSMIKSESLVDLNASETAREDLLREQGHHGIDMGALLHECPDDPRASDLVSELSPLIDPEDLLCEWSPLFDQPASTQSSPAAAELAFRDQEEALVLRLDNEEYEEELSLTSLDVSFCFEPEDYLHPNQKRQRRE